MPLHNSDIAVLLNRMADLLEIQNANPFRVRAYRNAARTVSGLSESVAKMLARGADLDDLPGIGRDLADKIAEIVATGHLGALDEIEREVPVGLVELMSLPGLGPKRVELLHQKLGIDSVKALGTALKSGKLRALKGFGAKTEERLRTALATHEETPHRFKRVVAAEVAEPLADFLRRIPSVSEVCVAGSYRRRRETVGDLDILVTCDARRARDRPVRRLRGCGPTSCPRARHARPSCCKAACRSTCASCRDVSYGAALHYFTGSKAHNIAVRKIAVAQGPQDQRVRRLPGRAGASPAAPRRRSIDAVGLPYIAPELREDRGEIEAARKGQAARTRRARRTFAATCTSTPRRRDGKNTIREMAEAAKARGYAYLAIADHTQHARIAHGLDPKRLAAADRRKSTS